MIRTPESIEEWRNLRGLRCYKNKVVYVIEEVPMKITEGMPYHVKLHKSGHSSMITYVSTQEFLLEFTLIYVKLTVNLTL